jgi:hypothetical protein
VFYTDLNKVVIGRQAPADDDLIYVNQKLSLPFHPQLCYTKEVSGYSEVGIALDLGIHAEALKKLNIGVLRSW